jgi:hypothetical protein
MAAYKSDGDFRDSGRISDHPPPKSKEGDLCRDLNGGEYARQETGFVKTFACWQDAAPVLFLSSLGSQERSLRFGFQAVAGCSGMVRKTRYEVYPFVVVTSGCRRADVLVDDFEQFRNEPVLTDPSHAPTRRGARP